VGHATALIGDALPVVVLAVGGCLAVRGGVLIANAVRHLVS
jgi:hypothetical protein